ncbi:helix-turn-helix domain-containing protein [Ramlibacter sp.]|uniref:helix-turn-helix domain-containing protein n=1 Tax=Ramlibacter sp. TaxID=1917967 RepID=UPI003D0CBE53
MYPVDTPQQLRFVLRSLRQSRGLTQAQLGERMGVSQKRIARIEGAPEVTSYDQIARIVNVLGYRLVAIESGPPQAREPTAW